jgi:hypothetical protein
MYVCPGCNREADPNASDVVPLSHWMRTESFGGEVEWVEGPGSFFHKGHTPKLGMEWRPATNPPKTN